MIDANRAGAASSPAERVARELARALRQELAQGLPEKRSHSAMLDLASRLSGLGGWHEAKIKADAESALKERAHQGALGGQDALAWAQLSLLGDEPLEPLLTRSKAFDGALILEGGAGSRYNAFSLSNREALGLALKRVVCSEGPEPGWSPAGWSSLAGGLFEALWPALEEGAAKGLWELDSQRLRRAASWEGVSELRSGPKAAQSPQARFALSQWAKPWHSSFAPPGAARSGFEAVERRWSSALDWLDLLASAPGESWGSLRSLNPLRAGAQASPRSLALVSALLEAEARGSGSLIQGARFKIPLSGLDEASIVLAARWFAPEPLEARLKTRRVKGM